MTLEDLLKIKNSLEELSADVEKFNWGPSLYFAKGRQKEALKIVRRAIKELKNEQK